MKLMQTLTAGLILSACSYLPVDTLRQLDQLDPMRVDPANIAVRFQLPAGLDMPEESVEMSLGAKHNNGEETSEIYILDRSTQSGEVTFRVAQSDLARLRAQQATVKEWGEDESEGTFSVSVVDLCTIGTGPADNARFSNLISLDGGDTFLPLITGYPLSEVLEKGAFGDLRPC